MKERGYVTIVSGLPRSGTSMMMRMISDGGIPALIDNVRTADVDNPNGYYEFEPVKQTKHDQSWVKQGVGKVVKMVHLLLLDLPLDYEYRVILMRRNLKEIVASQNTMLERLGKNVDGLPEDRLMDVYRAQLHQVTQYMRAHSDHMKFIEVDYNETLAHPDPPAQRISDFLDGLDTDRMLAVVDAGLYRNRLSE